MKWWHFILMWIGLFIAMYLYRKIINVIYNSIAYIRMKPKVREDWKENFKRRNGSNSNWSWVYTDGGVSVGGDSNSCGDSGGSCD